MLCLTDAPVYLVLETNSGANMIENHAQVFEQFEQMQAQMGRCPDVVCLSEFLCAQAAVPQEEGKYLTITDLATLEDDTIVFPGWDPAAQAAHPKFAAAYEKRVKEMAEKPTTAGQLKQFHALGYSHLVFGKPGPDSPWGANFGNAILVQERVCDLVDFDRISHVPLTGFAGQNGPGYRADNVDWRESRCAIVLPIRSRTTGRQGVVCTTHLDVWDPSGATAVQQAQELAAFLNDNFAGAEALLGGDLNSLAKAAYTDEEFNAVKWKCRLHTASPDAICNVLRGLLGWSIE